MHLDSFRSLSLNSVISGPPGQVKAIAGSKDGMKQGALGGVLKELGYTEDHVRVDLISLLYHLLTVSSPEDRCLNSDLPARRI